MGISLSSLRTDLRDHLGVDDLDLPDADADLLLNRSWWEVMNKLDFREKESSWTLTTVVGQRNYTCPVDQDAVQNIVVLDPNTEDYKSVDQLEMNTFAQTITENVNERGMPENYARRSNEILLHPVPDDVYTITVYSLMTLADLGVAGPPAPQEWHEIILFGACWRGFLKQGLHNRAKSIRKEQIDLINTTVPVHSKEQTDQKMAHLEVPGYLSNY